MVEILVNFERVAHLIGNFVNLNRILGIFQIQISGFVCTYLSPGICLI